MIMDTQYAELRKEIANHQEYVVRVAIYTFTGAVVALSVIFTRNPPVDFTMLGCSVGALLLCSAIYQNAAARKIFWIGGYLSAKTGEESDWENHWRKARTNSCIWFWVETRAIGYCYAIMTLVFVYLFKSSLCAVVVNVIAFAFSVWLIRVPSIDYKSLWEGLGVGSDSGATVAKQTGGGDVQECAPHP